jgi:hypothetical protein
MLSEKTIFVGSNINIRARGYTLPPPYGRRPNSKPERTGTWQAWGRLRLRPGPNRTTKKGGEHRTSSGLPRSPDPTGEIFELIVVAGCLGERALCQVGMYMHTILSVCCLPICLSGGDHD